MIYMNRSACCNVEGYSLGRINNLYDWLLYSMTESEFIEDVGIPAGEVGDNQGIVYDMLDDL